MAKKYPVDIGRGYEVTRMGFDVNGNHSVWVSLLGKRAKKIQTLGNLPRLHREREVTPEVAKEILGYLMVDGYGKNPAEIHVDINSHNAGPSKHEQILAEISRASKPKTKRGKYKKNPASGKAVSNYRVLLENAVTAAKTKTHLAGKSVNMLTAQARLSYVQGILAAGEVLGAITYDERESMLNEARNI